ncbi:hypothetical protein H4N58_02965 [Mumia sp. ZJ1417]|uniref:sensor histidine kinase n=1 Tax=unclassified Mumia TaxID=2621872 RepID=UPI00142265AA|nr:MULTISPECIES: histidine kinase [unclassified Mumia]QMW66925.1 hypothetical protein H4N58_02965 [Mumia sp. ZJ1417]
MVASLAALLLLDALVNDPSWSGWLGRGGALIGNTILFMGLPWLCGRYLRQVASHHAAAVEHAQLRERARIAQEMHDSLGHELSLIALRAGALEVRSGIPDEARQAAAALRSAAADATDRLGQIVGVLRPGEEEVPLEPAAASIAELVERARDSGLDVRLEGAADALAPLQQVAAHRVVQEGLTNAARHAPGAPVTVRLERGRQAVHVFVLNGAARERPRHGITSRLGLAGLDEAARAAGGSLRHGPTGNGGFALVAELPVTDRARRSAAEATS